MALTWAQARDKVRGDLWRPGSTGVPDDVCDRALHASLLEIEQARRFLFLEDYRTTVALTVAASSFAFPSDLRSLSSLSLIRADGKLEPPMERMSVERAKYSAAQVSAIGLPNGYAVSDGMVWLNSQADVGQAFALVGFFTTPDDLDAAIAGGATNLTLQKCQHLVIKGACADVAAGYMRNQQVAVNQRALFDKGLERLTDRNDEEREDTYGSRVQPDTYYEDIAVGR